MKALYLINGFTDGGAELGLATLAERGFFDGIDVTVCGLARQAGTVRERLTRVLGKDQVIYLLDRDELRDIDLPAAMVRLVAMLRRRHYDVLIASLRQANLVGRLAAMLFPRLRVVSFEHSVRYNRAFVWRLMSLTSRRVDAVWFDHEETWSAIRPLYRHLAESAAHDVPLTVLAPATALRPRAPGRWRILSTGRLVAPKNYAALIKAMRLLLDKGIDLELTIAGEGPVRADLELAVSENGLGGRVSLPGFVGDCGPLRRSSDLYVQCSDREGLCLGVLEAMAEGLLVVATDVGGIRRYGRDGVNMLKAKGSDAASLAATIEQALMSLPALHIRSSALALIEDQFTLSAVRKRWAAARDGLFGPVLGRAGGPAAGDPIAARH